MSVGAVNKQTGERIPTAGMPAVDSVLSGTSTNPVQNRVVKEALDGIKDGQSINSFADVETALSSKQNKLTFDDTPTDGSNNPVKSNGIYDALATKANTDMVAADFNAGTSYTAGNYCVQDGKLYKFKNNHSGAWSSADVDEVKITGELSSLKSGLSELGDTSLYNGIDYYIKKVGKMCILTINGSTDSFNVPAAYMPTDTYRGSVEDSNGDFVGRVVINAQGQVIFTPVSSTPKYGSITYFV